MHKPIQQQLQASYLDGWLIYDFRHSNRPALTLLGIPPDAHLTRRFFYWIPAEGEPVLIAHKIEIEHLSSLVVRRLPYATWRELQECLDKVLRGCGQIAMEYSPQGALPYLSLVDGGTLDLVRATGVEVRSSADLLSTCSPRQDARAQASHRAAAQVAEETVQRAWNWIGEHVASGAGPTEWDVCDFILGEFAARDCVTDSGPVCAVNAHAADPHYLPRAEGSATIEPNDWVLIDLWCRADEPGSIWADYTQVGVVAAQPTERQQTVFEVVKWAHEAALALIRERFKAGERLEGWEVDAACRAVMEAAGMADHFIHRTGHDIGTELHGRGAHLDDFETHDARPLVTGSCFSVEPGLYFPGEFGVRLECDVLVGPDGQIEVTGDPQKAIKQLI